MGSWLVLAMLFILLAAGTMHSVLSSGFWCTLGWTMSMVIFLLLLREIWKVHESGGTNDDWDEDP